MRIIIDEGDGDRFMIIGSFYEIVSRINKWRYPVEFIVKKNFFRNSARGVTGTGVAVSTIFRWRDDIIYFSLYR